MERATWRDRGGQQQQDQDPGATNEARIAPGCSFPVTLFTTAQMVIPCRKLDDDPAEGMRSARTDEKECPQRSRAQALRI